LNLYTVPDSSGAKFISPTWNSSALRRFYSSTNPEFSNDLEIEAWITLKSLLCMDGHPPEAETAKSPSASLLRLLSKALVTHVLYVRAR
jgi:hypothetical protein